MVPPSVAIDSVRVETDVGELWLPADDKVILPYMESTGVWEPSEGRILRGLLVPGARFLDVGANIGYFSALAAQCTKGGAIDAVEPEPRSVSLLRLNLWAHAPHATIWPLALGRARGVVTLNIETGNPGNTRVEEDRIEGTRLAALSSGDELFEGREFDVIKIDVQGYETDVVRGMAGIIQRTRKLAMIVEFFPASLVDRDQVPLEVLAYYRALGFERMADVGGKLLRLDDDELISVCASAGKNGFVNLLLRKG